MTRRYKTRKAEIAEAAKAAEAKGEQFFFTGKPCRKGHVAPRRTNCLQCVDCGKDRELREAYGITLEQFNKMLEEQHYCCAICFQKRPLSVDHCHKTNQVRGLLCRSCNIVVGHVENDKIVDGLQSYLQKWKSPAVKRVHVFETVVTSLPFFREEVLEL